MELVYMLVTVLIMGIVFAVLKSLWVGLAFRVFGWKPRILDEKQVARTVEQCTAEFFQQCHNLQEEQIAAMSDSDKRMMLEDIDTYTRFVIERYVQNYLLAH